MLGSKKIRAFFFFVLLIMISFGGGSCGKKMYPSGLEWDLMNYQGNFKREQQKRKRIARKNDRKMRREERKELKPILAMEKQWEKERKVRIKAHFDMQEPHVQARMKQNVKETRNKYPSRKSFKEKLVFWKKNKCPYGVG